MGNSRIYKYQVHSPLVEIHMNKRTPILSAQMQEDIPTFWALCDEDAEMSFRRFHLFTTGEVIPQELLEKLRYIGTMQKTRSTYVVHLFEEIN